MTVSRSNSSSSAVTLLGIPDNGDSWLKVIHSYSVDMTLESCALIWTLWNDDIIPYAAMREQSIQRLLHSWRIDASFLEKEIRVLFSSSWSLCRRLPAVVKFYWNDSTLITTLCNSLRCKFHCRSKKPQLCIESIGCCHKKSTGDWMRGGRRESMKY